MGVTRLLLLGLLYTIQMQIYVLFCTRLYLRLHINSTLTQDMYLLTHAYVLTYVLSEKREFMNEIKHSLYFHNRNLVQRPCVRDMDLRMQSVL